MLRFDKTEVQKGSSQKADPSKKQRVDLKVAIYRRQRKLAADKEEEFLGARVTPYSRRA